MKRMSQGVVMMVVVAYLLGGCATDPYTGEKKMSKAGWGAVIGSAGGAAVGALSGRDSEHRRKNALIGAGIGALAGASVGHYMGKQEEKLRQRLQGSGVSVTRQGDRIILNMPGNVTFNTASADISSNFFEVLNSVTLVLNEYNKTLINIYGHTDSDGSDAYNQSLSERRAASVGQYLISHQVNSERVMTMGYGETKPIATNNTPEGKQQNRRVELELAPLTQE